MAGDQMCCHYCGVPTAATIEHVHPQAQGGRSKMYNLVLACPYCNTRKSTRDVEEFKASGRWQLTQPPLPDNVEELLKQFFGWKPETGAQVLTGSPHSRLELRTKEQAVVLLVRPGRKYPWTETNLGRPDNPKVVGAAYDFLARHYTPPTPKEPHPMMQKLWGERAKTPIELAAAERDEGSPESAPSL